MRSRIPISFFNERKARRDELSQEERDVLDVSLLAVSAAGERGDIPDLLELGADINARDAEGNTPLMLAAENGYSATVATLLFHRADPSMTKGNETALTMAIDEGHVKTVMGIAIHLPNLTQEMRMAAQEAAQRTLERGNRWTYQWVTNHLAS